MLSIIDDIQLTEELLSKLKAIKEEPINKTALSEIQRKKSNLIKKLLQEMIEKNLSFNQYEKLYQKIFSYLKADENGKKIPINYQKNLKQVEQFLDINI